MKCSGCGFDNAAGMKFCSECGGALASKCRSCGFENPRGMKFCGECGKSLADPAAPVRSPDPRSYTPHHLAEKILTSRGALERERKQVTVLFADLKCSMDRSESTDPEEWHQILDRFFAILGEGVHRFQATINQYTGDGVFGLFGAPISHEDTRGARSEADGDVRSRSYFSAPACARASSLPRKMQAERAMINHVAISSPTVLRTIAHQRQTEYGGSVPPFARRRCASFLGYILTKTGGSQRPLRKEKYMPLYLIERNFAEQLNPTRDAVPAITQVNSDAGIQWLFSFLSADKKKTYCLYEAPNPEAIREAARKLNLPADVIVELGEFRITPGAPELLTPARGA